MNSEHSLIIGSRWQYDGRLYECIDIRDSVILLSPLIGSRTLYLAYSQFLEAGVKKRIFHIDGDEASTASKLAAQVSLLPEKVNEKVEFRRRLCMHILQKYSGVIPGELKYKEFCDEVSKALALDKIPPRSTLNSWYRKFKVGNYATAALVCESEVNKTRRSNISSETSDLIGQVIQEVYLNFNKVSIRETYNQFLNRLKFNNSRRDEDHKIASVSYETFREKINKISDLEKIEKRDGGFALRRHLKILKSQDKGSRIGAVTESDSHILDVIVIDEQSKVLGRPYLLVVLDVYTRVITGWELSFLPPCAAKTMRALRFAIDRDRNEFAACPEKLNCDNGPEFRNGSLQSAAERLSFELEWVPPHSPDSKPHVESFFNTLNIKLSHILPGTTFSSPLARGDYDSSKNAELTMEQLRQKFVDFLNYYHREKVHSALGVTPEKAWIKAKQKSPPIAYAAAEAELLVRKTVKRRLNGGFVMYNNLKWYSPALMAIRGSLGKNGIPPEVEISYDETNLERVWVRNPLDPRNLIIADARCPHLQSGLSEFEWLLIQKIFRAQYPESYIAQIDEHILIDLRKNLTITLSSVDTKKSRRAVSKTLARLVDSKIDSTKNTYQLDIDENTAGQVSEFESEFSSYSKPILCPGSSLEGDVTAAHSAVEDTRVSFDLIGNLPPSFAEDCNTQSETVSSGEDTLPKQGVISKQSDPEDSNQTEWSSFSSGDDYEIED